MCRWQVQSLSTAHSSAPSPVAFHPLLLPSSSEYFSPIPQLLVEPHLLRGLCGRSPSLTGKAMATSFYPAAPLRPISRSLPNHPKTLVSPTGTFADLLIPFYVLHLSVMGRLVFCLLCAWIVCDVELLRAGSCGGNWVKCSLSSISAAANYASLRDSAFRIPGAKPLMPRRSLLQKR